MLRGRSAVRFVMNASIASALLNYSTGTIADSMPSVVTFIHIPKTAGQSLIRDLESWSFVTLKRSGSSGNLEDCYSGVFVPGETHVALLRSPRAHVLSQFVECRDDSWGRKMTKNTDFPRGGSLLSDLDVWLESFPENGTNRGDFECYNPTNMQTRQLTCSTPVSWDRLRYPQKNTPHHVGTRVGTLNVSLAIHNLATLQVVGVTELYAEFVCLLEYTTRGYVHNDCSCDDNGSLRSLAHEKEHLTHGVGPHRVEALTPATLAHIDALTTLDRKLYSAAAQLFFQQAAAAERAVRHPFLCPRRLEAFHNISGAVLKNKAA